MIPKILHYCWFGGTELPPSVEKFVQQWKTMCPDYKIIEWNESNFDISSIKYVSEAYSKRKWAFVSDYARFVALYEYGGIYLDTDVEIVRSLDDLLSYGSFFGFGADNGLTVPFFGCEPQQECIRLIIEDYKHRNFVKPNGECDTTAIEKTVERVLCDQFSLELTGKMQVLRDNIAVFPKEYFFARDYMTGIVNKYPELYIIHYGDGTWLDEKQRMKLQMQHDAVRKYGRKYGIAIGRLKFYLKTEGVAKTLIRFIGMVKKDWK